MNHENEENATNVSLGDHDITPNAP
jgi:hypothetical protein